MMRFKNQLSAQLSDLRLANDRRIASNLNFILFVLRMRYFEVVIRFTRIGWNCTVRVVILLVICNEAIDEGLLS